VAPENPLAIAGGRQAGSDEVAGFCGEGLHEIHLQRQIPWSSTHDSAAGPHLWMVAVLAASRAGRRFEVFLVFLVFFVFCSLDSR
jgi:hypothetical protein